MVSEGEGAFYGPKIDLHMDDVLGRAWQMGTIQLDSQMPARFGLTYMGADNPEHMPYVIHRALFGSLERFIGILIEHYGGRLPVLARARAGARDPGRRRPSRGARRRSRRKLAATGSRSTTRDETVGKRIRDAEVEKIPVRGRLRRQRVGRSLAVRERGRRAVDEVACGLAGRAC